MINKLDEIVRKYERLQLELSKPEISSLPERSMPLLRELKSLDPLVMKIREYQAISEQLDQTRGLLSERDPEIRELAEAEIDNLSIKQEELEDAIKILMLPRDPADERSAILEIRAGTGGEEAALFAGDLLRMYNRLAEARNWKTDVMTLHEADAGGIKEVALEVKGDGVYGELKWESGVHRVQRVPVTESQGRIHTSAATVAVLPEAEEQDVHVRPEEIKTDVFRSSGAGGQHVNTTDSAVRLTHLPSGIVVTCQDERSQIKNRAKAMKVLKSKLLARAREEEDRKRSQSRRSQVGSGDRSEKIRTYNFPQNRVTDHRIGLTLYKLDRVMEGDLTEIIEALRLADRAERLQAESV